MDKNGTLIKTWGKKGSKLGEFNFAHSIVIDKNDRVFIADSENKRIQRFDLKGNALTLWTDLGYPCVLQLNNNH